MKSKRIGWHDLTTIIEFENGQEYVESGHVDPYIQAYINYCVGVRESCYDCRFKAGNSEADITIGDFWGIEDMEIDDNIGTSAVICRNKKGGSLVDENRYVMGKISKGKSVFDKAIGKGENEQ